MISSLGRLTQVDLKEAWTGEASDFTPWLASPDNLALLAEAIGLELECEAREQAVGSFRADILCKERGTDNFVLIENQLEDTDHGHLGQLITYAAGLKATTIVWICRQFREEHRAALDWLNEATNEQISFLGLEIELWKIGDSQVAPKFNVVCKPNDWSRVVSDAAKSQTEPSETKLLYKEYWQALKSRLAARGSSVQMGKPLAQMWMTFAVGKANCGLTVWISRQNKCGAVQLVLTGPTSESYFNQLEQERAEIERELAAPVDWRKKAKKERHIRQNFQNFDIDKKSDWERQQACFELALEAFMKCFKHRVKRLVPNVDEPDAELGE